MALTLTINLSEVEEMALRYIAADPQEWLESFVKYRSSVAIDEIYQKEVTRLTESGAESIPTNKTTVVLNAFSAGTVITVAESNALITEELAKITPAA
jgi:hypothetical protein